ncbi:MAG: 50S ribosomal protein L25 [Deltaproteobacteria bacterium]|nr:50S ribosomal protein L25 [Deltaproteobacteria bacterium]
MASQVFDVFARDGSGKGVARKLRRQGLVPAVLYGHEGARSLSVRLTDLQTVLKSDQGVNAILEISVDGDKKTVLLKDLQVDPIRLVPIHADLFEVSMDKKIRVMVEIRQIGDDPEGFKKGGILTHTLTSVEVECLPMEIPESFEVDLAHLDVGDAFHVSDIPDPGAKILTPGDQVLFHVVAPTLEKEPEAVETDEGVAPEGSAEAEKSAEESEKKSEPE